MTLLSLWPLSANSRLVLATDACRPSGDAGHISVRSASGEQDVEFRAWPHWVSVTVVVSGVRHKATTFDVKCSDSIMKNKSGKNTHMLYFSRNTDFGESRSTDLALILFLIPCEGSRHTN